VAVTRVVYEFGLAATAQPDGWVVSSAEPGKRRLFGSIAAVTETLGRLPCLVNERFDDGHQRSQLLRADSRTPFGLGITELLTGARHPGTHYHAYHIGYLVGAVAYHCERMRIYMPASADASLPWACTCRTRIERRLVWPGPPAQEYVITAVPLAVPSPLDDMHT